MQGRAGIEWDNVVNRVWKKRRKPTRDTVNGEVWGVQGRSKRKDRKKGKASVKKEGGMEKAFRDIQEVNG